jgi:hypothetical protein
MYIRSPDSCISCYTTINIFCSCTARVVVRSYIRAILAAVCFIGVLSHSQPAVNEKWVAPPIKLWLIIDPLLPCNTSSHCALISSGVFVA